MPPIHGCLLFWPRCGIHNREQLTKWGSTVFAAVIAFYNRLEQEKQRSKFKIEMLCWLGLVRYQWWTSEEIPLQWNNFNLLVCEGLNLAIRWKEVLISSVFRWECFIRFSTFYFCVLQSCFHKKKFSLMLTFTISNILFEFSVWPRFWKNLSHPVSSANSQILETIPSLSFPFKEILIYFRTRVREVSKKKMSLLVDQVH